jgi:hypothetical protein
VRTFKGFHPSSRVSGALVLYSLHAAAERWFAADERLVPVPTLPYAFGDSLKAPNIQLSQEGFVLGLLEIEWHNLADEGFLVVYFEGVAIGEPRNN